MLAISCLFSKSLLFEGHSKVFNVTTVSAKSFLMVLAVPSLFTSKVSFLIRFPFEVLVIFSFSIRIISD